MKAGIEIHQQLDTKKLFCGCESRLSDKVIGKITRTLRPTQSELGEVDRAALEESLKHRKFIYEITDNSCLVEADEEPPHDMNFEALKVAITVSLMLHARLVDEIHVMRKMVIDGSNTSGFQRTALVAVDGYIDTSFGRVRIPTICIEEEAARKIEEGDGYVVYRLDRLGIPLIEISTAPDMHSGDEVKEVAQKIGYILRSTKKVKRGAGTIRQDINISTGQGRIEIKGASKLNMIPRWVEMEVERQESLKEIAKILKERGAKVENKIYDITHIFEKTESKIIRRVIESGGRVLGIKLIGFKGVLKSGKYRLGRELAERVRVMGVRGLFHGDEMPGYGIVESEIEEIEKIMDIGENDSFVFIGEKEELGKLALQKVMERAKLAIEGVPDETRAPKDDGTTSYLRPLPGAARMYPETDIPPIRLDESLVEKLKENIPPMPEERVKSMVNAGISEQDAWHILHMGMEDIFDEIVRKYGYPTVVARSIINGCEGIDYDAIFKALKEGRYAKEAVDDIVNRMCEGEKFEDIMRNYEEKVDIDSIIDEVIREKISLIEERRENAFKPLMGIVMKKVRGKVDGKIVSEKLKRRIEEVCKKFI